MSERDHMVTGPTDVVIFCEIEYRVSIEPDFLHRDLEETSILCNSLYFPDAYNATGTQMYPGYL